MDSLDGDAQAGGLVHDDLGLGPAEAEDIAVDDLAGDDEAGQAAGLVDAHLRHRRLEGRFHLAGELDLHRAGQGLAVVDAKCETNVKGVFAAGDCTTVPYKQIIIATGEGAKASLSAFDYLIRTKTA